MRVQNCMDPENFLMGVEWGPASDHSESGSDKDLLFQNSYSGKLRWVRTPGSPLWIRAGCVHIV